MDPLTYILENISHLPDWMQFVIMILIIIALVLPSILGLLSKRAADRAEIQAIKAQDQAATEKDKREQERADAEAAREAQERDWQAQFDESNKAHERALEELRNDHAERIKEMEERAEERKQQGVINTALTRLIEQQMSQSALSMQAEAARQERWVEVNLSMTEVISQMKESTLMSFEEVRRTLVSLNESIQRMPVAVANSVVDEVRATVRADMKAVLFEHDSGAKERHIYLKDQIAQIQSKLARIKTDRLVLPADVAVDPT